MIFILPSFIVHFVLCSRFPRGNGLFLAPSPNQPKIYKTALRAKLEEDEQGPTCLHWLIIDPFRFKIGVATIQARCNVAQIPLLCEEILMLISNRYHAQNMSVRILSIVILANFFFILHRMILRKCWTITIIGFPIANLHVKAPSSEGR